MLRRLPNDYGGSLRNKRKGRVGARPLSTKHTMHLVLKSTKAKGEWNFLRPAHNKNIRRIIDKFAFVYGVKLVSFANASNHLHMQIRLSNRFAYDPFIRAITGAIALSVTGRTRWKRPVAALSASQSLNTSKLSNTAQSAGESPKPNASEGFISPLAQAVSSAAGKFWDFRPFTRIAESYRAYLNLKDYIRMNAIEAAGWRRKDAGQMVQVENQFRGFGCIFFEIQSAARDRAAGARPRGATRPRAI